MTYRSGYVASGASRGGACNDHTAFGQVYLPELQMRLTLFEKLENGLLSAAVIGPGGRVYAES